MIDILSLPIDTAVECLLEDLHPAMVERIRPHLVPDEEVILCAVVRTFANFQVQVITARCIVTLVVYVDKGKIDFRARGGSTKSILLSDFAGFECTESGPLDCMYYDLKIFGHVVSANLIFRDKETRTKYMGIILAHARNA